MLRYPRPFASGAILSMRTTLKRGVGRAADVGGTDGNGMRPGNGGASGPPRIPPPPLSPDVALRRRTGAIRSASSAASSPGCSSRLLVTAGGLAGGLWLYGEQSLADTRPQTKAEKEAEEILDEVPPADQPAVAIVDRLRLAQGRVGEARSPARTRSCSIRADPRQKTISMLSFPRDLLVEIPPCNGQPAAHGEDQRGLHARAARGA